MKGGALGTALVKGTLWSVSLRWVVKVLGIFSTLVLARLLAPDDYGVMAMAMLFVSFIDTFFSVSSEAVLLRDPNASRELIDSAWTLKVLQSAAVAVVVACISPLAALYFHDARVVPVMLVLCIGIAVSGLTSYGPLLARKDLDFGLEVRLAVIAKTLSVAVTIALAYWLRNYWALVIGTVFGYSIGCVLSYVLHPYRGRFTLMRFGEIWRFSQWMLVAGIGQFFVRKADEFFVGRLGSASSLGLYSIAADLGQTITMEVSAPINRALLPVLAQINAASDRLREAMKKTLAASNLLILPAGFGLAAVAEQAVAVLLGDKWMPAAPMLAVFSIAWALRYMNGPYYVILMIRGDSRTLGLANWAEAGLLVVLGLALLGYGVFGLVWARALTCIGSLVLWLGIGPSIGVSLRDFWTAVWRPLVGAIAMAALLRLLPQGVWIAPLFDLALRIALGGLFYSAWVVASWMLLGRPDGLEARVIGALQSRWRATAKPADGD
ncbi:MAG TPA: oligosaccharide flippase family protein [Casimicrobiaceae bacterium]|nr:oligosaccharide flippase family protein [Casimicrobiaceae bacterium]